MVHTHTIKCRICGKIINTVVNRIGSGSYGRKSKTTTTSKDGVFFQYGKSRSGVWFCKSCWEEVRK